MKMNVVFSSSDSYAEICGIALLSLLENNKKVESIDIYIIDNNIGDLNKKRLNEIAHVYGRNLIFEQPLNLEKLANTHIYVGRWNIGTFFRLYLGTLLPKTVERVMYFDCDTIVRHDLSGLFALDLGNCSCAGVDDCRSDLYRVNLGEKPGCCYTNNGFLLIDLAKWRQENIEKDFTEYINEYKGDITYMDQGVMNAVLGPRGEIKELPCKFNAVRIFFDFSYDEIIKLRKPTHYPTREEYEEAVNDPVIVHFTPVFITGTRPWNIKDNHKFTSEWLKYKAMSPYKDEPQRKDDRKSQKKLMTFICKMMPRKLMISVMSYFHATWYPKKRIKIMEKNLLSKGSK